jgi:hypothetical protein
MNKKWHLWRWLALTSILLGILLAIFQPTLNNSANPGDFEWQSIVFRLFGFAPLCFFVFALLVFFLKFGRIIFQRLFTWRTLKWCLWALVALMILVALLYVEENWRGKQVWDSYKHELEAKGEKLDFASFIPPPVPDDQNFALTPVVVSSYSRFLDTNGHRLSPENTNIVNRLDMKISRPDYNGGTNSQLGLWQRRTLTDLKGWQDYYRVTAITNVVDSFGWQGAGNIFVSLTNESGNITKLQIQILATNQFPYTAQPQSPAADVLFALSKYDPVIEELREASRLPLSRFPLNYTTDSPQEVVFFHSAPLKSSALALRLRAIAELDDGQTDEALADVRLILYLANSIRHEPIPNSFECQMAIVNLAVQPIWEGLARRQWSADQLAVLEQDLAGIDTVKDYNFALRAALAFNFKTLEYLRTEGRTNVINDGNDDVMWMPTLIFRLSPDGWFRLNERATATVFEAALPTAAETAQGILSPEITARFGRAESSERRSHLIPDSFWLGFVPPLPLMAMNSARIQSGVDMARIACALERYRLAHDGFPETLAALVPQFIEKLPHDIINGQPLHYRRMKDGQFILYSIGWNGKDDDGQPEDPKLFPQFNPNGDWVWQYQAK